MKVTVMYRNNWFGGDGWTYYPVTVEIADTCPVCGGPRGEVYVANQCEDGEWFTLSRWENACGHLDTYADVLVEAGYAKRPGTPETTATVTPVEPVQERPHLMSRPADWATATDADWLDALTTTPRPIDPRFMAFAQRERPHVLRQSLLLHEQMGGYLGAPAPRFLKRRR